MAVGFTPMKILVTGAAGQLGSYLAEHLSKEHEVVALDINQSGNPIGKSEFVQGDVNDYRLAMRLCKNVDTVIHAAAQVSLDRSVADPVFDAKENILGTVNMLEAATKCMVEQFVYISSAAIFGEPEKVPVGEDHPCKPLSPYGVSKLAGEHYAFAFLETYGLNVTSIRPFNIYSPRQDPNSPYSGVITRFVERAAEGKSITVHGDGEQTRDFVSARDVVQLVEKCLGNEKVRGKTLNCGTGVPTTINELAEMIIELSGKEREVERTEPRKGDIRHSRADISKAKKLLGYAPQVKLKKGLAELF
jgi:UDP-glucose 4-epimerase